MPNNNRRICLIGPSHPTCNPRLVRNAVALAGAGYEVAVVTTCLAEKFISHDAELAGDIWSHTSANLAKGVLGRIHWHFARTRKKCCLLATKRFATPFLIKRACTYAGPEMTRIACKMGAALYIAQQQVALPAACDAAARTGALVAFDAEDLLAEYSSEPVEMMRSIEERYVPKCAFVSTMSGAAASRLQETLNLPVAPLVLHNTPSLAERHGVPPPSSAPPERPLQLYWFGQTIGPHSCAEHVLRAMSLMSRPARLVLRGNPIAAYIIELKSRAASLGLTDHLEVHERAPPTEMVRLAAEHDVLLGAQPSLEPFHQMAIGNKVFTGLMAGLVVALTDTVAHRLLAREVGEAGFLFANDDHLALANRLNELDESRDKLIAMKTAAWRIANERFNWEKESEQLLSTVALLLGKAS